MAFARAAAIVAAILVCAWFALGARQAHEINTATRILSQSGPLRAAQMRQASDSLHAAGTLNPDRQVDILRGELATAEGRLAQARKILGRVTESEPKNLSAWIAFGHASADDEKAFLESVARVSQLVAHLH